MSTPFLQAFALGLVTRLLRAQEILVAPGREAHVVRFVAERLARAREGGSLVSTAAAALLACDDVEDLFADNETIKRHIVDMGSMDG